MRSDEALETCVAQGGERKGQMDRSPQQPQGRENPEEVTHMLWYIHCGIVHSHDKGKGSDTSYNIKGI